MKRDIIGWSVAVLVAALLPLVIRGDPYLLLLANLMLMFMVLALSWDLVARAGLLSLAHAAFFGAGAYTVAICYKFFGFNPLLGMVIAIVVVGAMAVLLGVVTLRLRGIYFAIATLAFALNPATEAVSVLPT